MSGLNLSLADSRAHAFTQYVLESLHHVNGLTEMTNKRRALCKAGIQWILQTKFKVASKVERE